MEGGDTIGSVVAKGDGQFEWTIPEFSELPPRMGAFFYSPLIDAEGILFFLEIHPNGHSDHTHPQETYVTLYKMSWWGYPSCTLGFKHSEETENYDDCSSPSCDARFHHPLTFLIDADVLSFCTFKGTRRELEGELPDGQLTVTCRIGGAKVRLTSGAPSLESLSSDFCQFLEDKTLSDVILKCQDRAVSAHRAVLAARSPVFAAMFRTKMAESETGTVDMSDVDADVLESFLRYVYSGKLTAQSEDSLSQLFSMADKYQVRCLQEECSHRIFECLNRENCIGFLQLADVHNYEDLRKSVVEYVTNESDVFKTEGWTQFKKRNSELALSIYEVYMRKKDIL